jgi:predicted Zn-dependent protease
MSRRALAALVLALCAVALAPAAHAQKRTVLESAYDDRDAGAQGAKGVEAQIGLLGDKDLDAYIQGIGDKLLRAIPNRPFAYQFRVVDQVEPNAFALPGGHIYVSRGLMALANDEDELACVIGHEIGHVAKRHAAAQQGAMKGVFPLMNPMLRQGQMAAYSRDLERSADHDGQILCAAAGYDPLGLPRFLESLMNFQKLQTGTIRSTGYFDTHPGSSERAVVARVEATELRWKRDPKLGDPRAVFLAHIDGLPVGQRPESGIFLGDVFLHPGLGFKLRFPRGWAKQNTPMAVAAQSPRGDAIVYLEGDAAKLAPRQAAEAWASENVKGMGQVEKAGPFPVSGLPAWKLDVAGSNGRGRFLGYVTFIPFRDAIWRITGASMSDKELAPTLATTRSFHELSPEDLGAMHETRIAIVKAEAGENLAALKERTSNVWPAYETAIYNALQPSGTFKGGESVKIAKESPYQR